MSILVVPIEGRCGVEVCDGGKLRVTRTPFLPEMTEKEADRERRANRPPRSDDDRGGRGGDRGGRGGDRRGRGGDRNGGGDRGRGRR